jgi:hypothetical protein
MPKAYDLEQARHVFDTFGLAHLRDACTKTPQFPGYSARVQMDGIVQAWLLGREAEVREPLATLLQWFEQADFAHEQFGESPHHEAARRNDAHGLALWFSNGVSSKLPHQLAVQQYELHFQSGHDDFLHGSLEDYLASCLLCGEFARGAALYEKMGGKTGVADSKIRHGIELGYWLCKGGAEGNLPAQQCGAIGARVLSASLAPLWLGTGHELRAASWLRIVADLAQWKLSPRGVMQRAAGLIRGATK